MNEIFFRPEQAWLGDCTPCYHDGSYYMYYQCDRREPKPFPNGEPFGWSLAVSKDLVSFRDYGEVLYKGEHGSREHCLYAGSVIHALGKFRAFYTGECKYYLNRPDMPPKEVLMLAVSDDGIKWEKQKKLSFSAPAGFERIISETRLYATARSLANGSCWYARRRKTAPGSEKGFSCIIRV